MKNIGLELFGLTLTNFMSMLLQVPLDTGHKSTGILMKKKEKE